MSKWEESALNKIGTVISGGTPSTTNSLFWDGDILFVTPYDLSRIKTPFIENSERKISKEGLSNSSANLLPVGSIIISSRAPIGYLAIAKKEFTTNQGCKSIVPNSNFDSEYFYYSLNYYVERIKRLGAGSTFAEISKKDLELVKLPHPKEITEQRKIANILSTADAVIEKTQDIIAKYKAIKQGMLHDLFTRGIDIKTGKLRPTYKDAPDLYKPSKLGMIPEDWNVERIDNLCKITTGSKDTQNKQENGIYPFFVRSQTIERINSYSYDGEAILTSGDGVGVGKIYHYINGKFDFHQRVYMLYEFEKTVITKFLFYYFSNNFFAEVDKYSAKTTVDSVRMEMIAGMLIPVPNIQEQTKISEKLVILENKLDIEQNYLQKLQQIKAGLMSDLLNGKVKVNVKEKLVTQTKN